MAQLTIFRQKVRIVEVGFTIIIINGTNPLLSMVMRIFQQMQQSSRCGKQDNQQ